MTLGVYGSPATLDPYSKLASDLTYELAVPVYPSLFRFDPAGTPHAYLASAVAKIAGGVRVTLRKARWSTGQPVSAADVVATVRRAGPPSGFSHITSARAVGKRTVELHGKISDWKRLLATVAYVLPGGKPRRISAGPFEIAAFTPGLQVTFHRNPKWWGRPLLDGVKVEFAPSLQILLLLLKEGKLDAAAPPSSVNLDDRLDQLGMHHSDALGWESIQLRFTDPGLTPAQRRAVMAAVDRRRLSRGFIRGAGRVSNALHPGPGRHGVRGPWSRPMPPGGVVHRRLILSAPSGDELLELLQRVLQSEMSKAATDLEVATVDPQTFYGAWRIQSPTQIALSRVAGAPGLAGDGAAYRRASSEPLFQVETVLAWRDGIRGLRADPTFDGPLWNVEAWSRGATTSSG
ncbi:MAG: peptide/nickel transport system substrate-binding protein [Actinomycetota bacterium]|nr:peptide/nickel transport system substrate-binding protein [Actinomycetota bacterium]